MTRDQAIEAISTYFDEGTFQAELANLVSYETESQNPDQAPELKRYLVETMEPRRMLTADPLQIGATYLEEDFGGDEHGDTFEITFQGGAANTELTRLIIDGDQGTPGMGQGDMIFDTEPGGLGADESLPFTLLELTSQDPNASVTATVADGGHQLVVDLVGFRAGDHRRRPCPCG